MTHRRALFAAVLSAALAVPAAHAGEQYALLIAVQDYPKTEFNPLTYTRDDMSEFRRVLLDSGFRDDHVVFMNDKQARPDLLPEIKKIHKQIDLLLAVVGRDDTLIVALSGHGVDFALDKHSYFCPLDGELGDKKSLLDLDELYGDLKDCKAQKKLLLADCCRNDPQSKISKSARPEVDLKSDSRPQDRDVPEGVVALFSCSAGEKSYEPDDLKHGIFFNFLIKGWRGDAPHKEGKVTMDDVIAYAISETQTYARVKLDKVQRPQRKNEFSGEWVLNDHATGTSGGPQPTPTKSGEPLTFKGHSDKVMRAVFSRDGKTVASGSLDKTIKLWDASTGKESDTLDAGDGVTCMAFGPSDKTLAAGTSRDDCSVRVWSLSSKTMLWSRKCASAVRDLACGPDGKVAIVTDDATKETAAFDADGKPLWRVTNEEAGSSILFSPDGKQLTVLRTGGRVVSYEARTGLEAWSVKLPKGAFSFAYRPDGEVLAVGLSGGAVQLVNARTGQLLNQFQAHDNGTVFAIAYRPDGKYFVTGSIDKTLKIWDATTFKEQQTLAGHTEVIYSAAFSPDGKRVVSASGDKTVKIWDVDLKK